MCCIHATRAHSELRPADYERGAAVDARTMSEGWNRISRCAWSGRASSSPDPSLFYFNVLSTAAPTPLLGTAEKPERMPL
jgi:hypothetical protein